MKTVIEQNMNTGHYFLISGSLTKTDILTFYNGRYFGLHSNKWVLSEPNKECVINNANPKVFVNGINGQDKIN